MSESKNQPQITSQSPTDPQIPTTVYGMQKEDEVDLLEYWHIIWAMKVFILSVTFAAAILAATISLTMPNIYRADLLIAPVSEEGKVGGLSSTLGSLGGLASLASVNINNDTNVQENLAVLSSREFIWSFIKDKKLMPVLFPDQWDTVKKKWLESDDKNQPSLWDAYRLFSKEDLLSVSIDKTSGLVTLSVEWTDANLAAQWGNLLVQRLNDHLRQIAIKHSFSTLEYLNKELLHTQIEDQRRILFELISQEQKKAMLANTRKQFAFRVIDQAVAPDKKSKPKRALIVILTSFIVGFLSIIVVFIREGIKNRAAKME